MKRISSVVAAAVMIVIAAAACSRRDPCREAYSYDTGMRLLGDGSDCGPCARPRVPYQREFFQPYDFDRPCPGRGYYPGGRHRDCGLMSDRCPCCGERLARRAYRCSPCARHRFREYADEDVVSERYAPPIAPDTEYRE